VSNESNYNKVSVLIVGAGPAGLACAIKLKHLRPKLDVCVIEKAAEPGNHNLSGAILEPQPLVSLLDSAAPDWRDSDDAKHVLCKKVKKEKVLFVPNSKRTFNMLPAMQILKLLGLGTGQMIGIGHYIVSISELTKWLSQIAKGLDVEVLCGFAAEDIVLDERSGRAVGVKLVDQGLDKEGNKQPNYLEGEIIQADFVVLAEGCDGLVTEKFIEKTGLERKCPQLFSIGVKELIKVSSEQYKSFTASQVVHAMGWPIWTPVVGPAMFGGGIIYPGNDEHIAVGMIVGADWKYCDFNPQDALTRFKEHKFVRKFVEDGTVVEAGAKMIPEGGYYSLPREPQNESIGKGNVLLVGDSAGFVNMLKIRGLHLAIGSGIKAAQAISENLENPLTTALKYTQLVDSSDIAKEMRSARNFRQTIAKLNPLAGMPLSVLGGLLPRFNVEPDYKAMTTAKYRLKPDSDFDKATFAAMAATAHREDQPCHLKILDSNICRTRCTPVFESPCITFCPAGVYETVAGDVKPANPSNCLHCKTCQRKCPFDNIRWTVPEGGGGPRYKRM
jgi:electron-transferring-flavoprotein dehydrogenase